MILDFRGQRHIVCGVAAFGLHIYEYDDLFCFFFLGAGT